MLNLSDVYLEAKKSTRMHLADALAPIACSVDGEAYVGTTAEDASMARDSVCYGSKAINW